MGQNAVITPICLWFFAFAAPAIAVATVNRNIGHRSDQFGQMITHAVLAVSLLVMQLASLSFQGTLPFFFSWLALSGFLVAIAAGFILIGRTALFYGLSALLQQLTLLSTAYVLLSVFPLWVVTLLIVPPFVISHDLGVGRRRLRKAVILCVWGCLSLVLFSLGTSVFVIAAVHLLLGSTVMSFSIVDLRPLGTTITGRPPNEMPGFGDTSPR